MKKLYIILIAIASFAAVSCNNLLQKDPLTKFTNDNYWTSEANVELYANYFYSYFVNYGTGGSGNFYFPSLNDNQVGSSFVNWKSTSVDASNSTWNNSYTEIRRTNIMLEKIPTIASMSDTKKAKWIGIGRLYRALYHYELVRAFGDCYYVDKVLVPADEDILYGKRQDRDGVMDKVLDDLNYAVANIPSSTSRTEFNKDVANAIKAEICLYEATFCKYRTAADNGKAPDATRAAKYFAEAITACQAIMSTNAYELSPTYKEVYNSFDLSKNKEMIMFKKYDVASSLTHGIVDYCASSTTQRGISKSAFDSFLFIDGKPLALTSCDKNDHATFKQIVDADGQENWEGNLDAVLAVRDPRLSADIDTCLQYRGTPWVRKGTDGQGMPSTSSSGYGVFKFENLEAPYLNRTTGNKNYTDGPVYWYANILLNYAEACAETGKDAEAIGAIDKIRTRAGLPTLTSTGVLHDPANNMGVSDLIWEVRRERRIELMYDNDDRYWCLIRWHQLDKLDTEKYPEIVAGAWIGDHVIKDNHPDVDANGYITTAGYGVRKYEPRQYLRPIPSGQADYNENIGQNPGW